MGWEIITECTGSDLGPEPWDKALEHWEAGGY